MTFNWKKKRHTKKNSRRSKLISKNKKELKKNHAMTVACNLRTWSMQNHRNLSLSINRVTDFELFQVYVEMFLFLEEFDVVPIHLWILEPNWNKAKLKKINFGQIWPNLIKADQNGTVLIQKFEQNLNQNGQSWP